MALQGDLNTFALPDVLRLLASTGKSGRLEIVGGGDTGEILLADGAISAAAASIAPHAASPSDVVFELLRMSEGSFAFDEGEVADQGVQADVETTLTEAEALVEEWVEVEAVVPSMEAWVTLAPELDVDEVVVSAAQWRSLATLAGGGNVHDLADALALTDLAASRQVKDLVEATLVVLRPSHGYTPPAVELDDFEPYEADMGTPMTDFEDLVVEDRPVVMEDRDDALLPEPLPGEGVAYEGESIIGVVDGRTFDSVDADGSSTEGEAFAAFESLASFEQAAAMSELAGEPGTIDTFGDVSDFHGHDHVEAFDGGSAEAVSGHGAISDTTWAPEATAAGAGQPVDDERGSLLKFLSTVKP